MTESSRSHILTHRLKLVVMLVWLGIFLGMIAVWWQSGVGFKEVPHILHHWLAQFGFWHAASIYVVLYTIRPLILFPATLLTVTSGLVFGPWWGIIFTLIGENLSANFAFLVGRRMGQRWMQAHESNLIKRWEQRMVENGMMSILLMRLLCLPFDAVNYAAGMSRISQRDFALGTFLGILPALVAFALIGGSLSAETSLGWELVVFSIVIYALSFLLSLRLKRQTPEWANS